MFGRSRGLVVGILYGFDPYLRAPGKAIAMRRAIADGVDVGEAAATILVHDDTVVRFGVRFDERRDRRQNANSDDHHVCWDHLPIRQCHAGDGALTDDVIHRDACAQIYPMGTMNLFIEARNVGAGDTRKHAVERFE